SEYSLVSLGTEKMLLDFGKANLISKARQQPEKVKQVLSKIQTDGFWTTYEAVKNKLDTPLPLGYSNCGIVKEVGSKVTKFQVGDRVVSNGPHADVVAVSEFLCAKVPDGVSPNEASFTVLGAIALQGIRLAHPTLGETVVVVGLGVIGLLTVQLLKANGCKVIAFDLDERKVKLAESYGATAFVVTDDVNPVAIVNGLTAGIGADACLVTASTKSSKPMEQAAGMLRKRGRIILVGVTGLELNRSDFYEKEITFQVSCSYGPGRYDESYEKKSRDYPEGFVRWTAGRNFEAFLDLLNNESIEVKSLITSEHPIEEAPHVYKDLGGRGELGVLLRYEQSKSEKKYSRTIEVSKKSSNVSGKGRVSVIGSGIFAKATLLPCLKEAGFDLAHIVSQKGMSGFELAKKFGIENAGTDVDAAINDPSVDTVVIATRHNTHLDLVKRSLEARKNVFVEKPLVISSDELNELKSYLEGKEELPLLMVGFNRRFSPLIQNLKKKIDSRGEPLSLTMMINSGEIPKDHWLNQVDVGGGRLVGEGCHFVDLARFIVGKPIKESFVSFTDQNLKDSFSINLKFEDESIASINYFSNGNKNVPKETIDIYCQGEVYRVNNFRSLEHFGVKGNSKEKLSKLDKGHLGEMTAFLEAIKKKKSSLIPLEELIEVSDVCNKLAGN
ncbi:MAG: bi-domain-containing oxidoreductase, partial [Bacteriovoracaceae bacterium]